MFKFFEFQKFIIFLFINRKQWHFLCLLRLMSLNIISLYWLRYFNFLICLNIFIFWFNFLFVCFIMHCDQLWVLIVVNCGWFKIYKFLFIKMFRWYQNSIYYLKNKWWLLLIFTKIKNKFFCVLHLNFFLLLKLHKILDPNELRWTFI